MIFSQMKHFRGGLAAALFSLVLPLTPLSAAETEFHYLTGGEPHAIQLLAPPPLADSMEQAADLAEVRLVSHDAPSNEVAQALVENKGVALEYFMPIVGEQLLAGQMPKTEAFLKSVHKDAAQVVDDAKDYWKRPRPRRTGQITEKFQLSERPFDRIHDARLGAGGFISRPTRRLDRQSPQHRLASCGNCTALSDGYLCRTRAGASHCARDGGESGISKKSRRGQSRNRHHEEIVCNRTVTSSPCFLNSSNTETYRIKKYMFPAFIMKKLNILFAIVLTAGTLLSTNVVQAQGTLKITEVESDEASGKVDGNSKPDWFELSNLGNATISLSGYTMDDNSDSYALSVPLIGITSIAAGESVIFFESTGGFTTQNFIDWWGVTSPPLQIGSYSGSGVSLGSSGDQVNIFDSTGTAVDGVNFSTATTGSSFVFDAGSIGRSPTGVSQVGVNGAFTSLKTDIGSPGVVPEPSTYALAGGGLIALAGFRRLKNRQA
jgi:hypothetical protein